MSRTQNAIKNIAFGTAGRVVNLIVSFLSRTIFIAYLDTAYLGVNGLYSEILSVLSVAELGFGSALIYALYKPVAENDEKKCAQLMCFYRNAYRIIAGIILVVGLALIPALPHIVKDADFLSVRDLQLYYVLFLINTVTGYFVTYKYSFFNALQKNYIGTCLDTGVNLIIAVFQIIIIIKTQNFLAYLLTRTILLICSRFIISVYLNHKFPILKVRPDEPLDREEKKKIYKDVRALASGQIASAAVHSTDNIIITAFTGLGLVTVGLVSNYTMLISSVTAFLLIIFNSVTSGFGNLIATSSQEHYHRTFLDLNFLMSWVYGFCSIAFFILVPPFISLWIGPEYQIDNASFSLIILNVYLQGYYSSFGYSRVGKGNFSIDILPVICQPIVNLVVSIAAAMAWGLVGVYVGTIASRLVLMMRPIMSYRFLFGRSPFEYYRKLTGHFLVTLLACAGTYLCTHSLLGDPTWVSFVVGTCIVAIVPNLIYLILFSRSKDFKSVWVRLNTLLQRRKANG